MRERSNEAIERTALSFLPNEGPPRHVVATIAGLLVVLAALAVAQPERSTESEAVAALESCSPN